MRKLILLIVVILVMTFCIRVGVYFKTYHYHYASTSFQSHLLHLSKLFLLPALILLILSIFIKPH
ncbi:MAG: hypothetical protein ACI32Q_00160 [Intestinibaculum porci]|uniref:hypothetical protein n=1 Tax=Intestinibaculum porci TaxID=2487118 RepID=UPI003F129082